MARCGGFELRRADNLPARAAPGDCDPPGATIGRNFVMAGPDHAGKAITGPFQVGIGLDDWKLAIFKRHLDEAGYSYEPPVTLIPGTLILKVKTNSIAALKIVIEAAQKECRECRKNQEQR
jgi:hypothetical protein